MSLHSPRATALWVAALVLSVAAVAGDGVKRHRALQELTRQRASDLPAPLADTASPTGYAGGAHRLVLPAIDGYAWLLQTEVMLRGGGARVRDTDADGAPGGREVHWAGPMRWWIAGLVTVHRLVRPDLSEPQSLERVAPWANTLALLLLLVVVTPALALGMGGAAAALFALGCVAVFPLYELFVVGYVDHHGLVTMACGLAVLLLVRGGGGWVRSEGAVSAASSWVPERTRAGRWFVASGIAGAVGVWINAATALPVLAAVGLGAFVAAPLGRAERQISGTVWEPQLWRRWGWSGAAACFVFYLVEYFPSRLGLRLEVNHPLYALAWAAGGDLLARVGGAGGRSARRWIALAAAVLTLPAALIFATGPATFALSDPFLARLHQRHIAEFLPLATQLGRMDPGMIVARLSAIVLVALPLAALLWRSASTDSWRWARRGGVMLAVAVTMAFAHVVLAALAGGRTPLALVGDVLLLVVLFVPWVRPGSAAPLARSVQSLLALVLIPVVVLLALSLAQVRWVAVASALALVAAVGVAAAVRDRASALLLGSPAQRIAAGSLLVVTLVLSPLQNARLPVATTDAPQLVVRDLSWWLRRRVGEGRPIVFASPNATLGAAWFGGFRGLGTLYWENREGLRASMTLWVAPTADSVRALARAHDVRFMVFQPSDRGLESLADAAGTDAATGYLPQLVAALRSTQGEAALPAWLVPVPYPAPRVAGLGQPSALILEVIPDAPPEATFLRLAQYYQAAGVPEAMDRALRASLQARPTAAAWGLRARLDASRNDMDALAVDLRGLRAAVATDEPIPPGGRADAAAALALVGDTVGVARQLDLALRSATDGDLRGMPSDALAILVTLGRRLGMDRLHPEPLARAEALLP